MPPFFNSVGFPIEREVRLPFCYHKILGRVGVEVRLDVEPGPLPRSTATDTEVSTRDVEAAIQEKYPFVA